jgi:hypothetical protein
VYVLRNRNGLWMKERIETLTWLMSEVSNASSVSCLTPSHDFTVSRLVKSGNGSSGQLKGVGGTAKGGNSVPPVIYPTAMFEMTPIANGAYAASVSSA